MVESAVESPASFAVVYCKTPRSLPTRYLRRHPALNSLGFLQVGLCPESATMARPKSLIPSYRRHAGTGQAVTTITGPTGSRREAYLGLFGSDSSIITYGRRPLHQCEWLRC